MIGNHIDFLNGDYYNEYIMQFNMGDDEICAATFAINEYINIDKKIQLEDL